MGFTRSFNPEEVRSKVFAFNWQSVDVEFTGEVAAAKERAKPKKKLTEGAASKLMFDYFMANKASLPQSIKNFRGEIVLLIMSGTEPEVAFLQVLE